MGGKKFIDWEHFLFYARGKPINVLKSKPLNALRLDKKIIAVAIAFFFSSSMV